MKYNFNDRIFNALFMVFLSGSVLSGEALSEKYFNPKPLADDVVLPMPCGGSMVFRKVSIPLPEPLDDYPVMLGQDGVGLNFAEHTRPSFIAGSFSEVKPAAARYFLMSKYEMTELQYRLLIDDTCPTASNKLRLPALPESWFSAVGVADRYNKWLRENAKEFLPVEDGKAGFVRLPTETEWEFAARGGIAVSAAEFRDLTYPMPDGISNYEWFAGAQSSNGKLQLAGLLQPNPLGLHDMLGNADEMLIEPFRLNKLDREHGQAGGYLVRGGNYLSAQADIRSSNRREESYYPEAGVNKVTGLRLVIGSTTFTSRERVQAIETAWGKLGKSNGKAEAGEKTAIGELGQLASNVQDQELKQKLKSLEAQIRANNQQQEEARDQAIRASLNLGAFLCTKMLDDGKFVDFLQKNYDLNCTGGESNESCPARLVKLNEQKDRIYKLGRYYASTVVETSTLYSSDLIARQVPVLFEIINSSVQLKELSPYLDVHWNNQNKYLQEGRITVDDWIDNCKKTI